MSTNQTTKLPTRAGEWWWCKIKCKLHVAEIGNRRDFGMPGDGMICKCDGAVIPIGYADIEWLSPVGAPGEVERLREALERIASAHPDGNPALLIKIARAALCADSGKGGGK